MSDIRMHECNDGGDFILTDGGDLEAEGGYFTAMYLSLFEGVTFYNSFEDENTDDINFEDVLRCEVTAPNLNKIADTVVHKLQWMVNDGLCEKVTASAKSGEALSSILLEIITSEPDGVSNKYGILWDGTKAELKYKREVR